MSLSVFLSPWIRPNILPPCLQPLCKHIIYTAPLDFMQYWRIRLRTKKLPDSILSERSVSDFFVGFFNNFDKYLQSGNMYYVCVCQVEYGHNSLWTRIHLPGKSCLYNSFRSDLNLSYSLESLIRIQFI